jgi:hypothetical protein
MTPHPRPVSPQAGMSPSIPEKTNIIAFNHKKILCSNIKIIIQTAPDNGLKIQIHQCGFIEIG